MFRIELISKTSPRGKLPANEKIGGYDCHFVPRWRHENQETARGNAQLEFYKGPSCTSLRRRRNLTSFCNVCEAVPRSLFWAPNGFNELPEVRFEFPFILPDRQIDNGFFNRPIMARTQIPVHRWGPEQGFRRCFVDGLNQS